MFNSLFSLLLEIHRKKATKAYVIYRNEQKQGQLYIQQGTPLSCFYGDFQGVEALHFLYREQRSGIALVEFQELDCLAIYSENIKEQKFETLLMTLLEKQKLRKIYLDYSLVEKQTLSYWQ